MDTGDCFPKGVKLTIDFHFMLRSGIRETTVRTHIMVLGSGPTLFYRVSIEHELKLAFRLRNKLA